MGRVRQISNRPRHQPPPKNTVLAHLLEDSTDEKRNRRADLATLGDRLRSIGCGPLRHGRMKGPLAGKPNGRIGSAHHLSRMTIPGPGQTVHMMTLRDVLRVKWQLHRKEGRNVRELQLYTTDDLRDLYQSIHASAPIGLRDGIVTRVQPVAEIRWRVFWSRFGYALLLFLSAVAAVAGVIAAVEGWK